MLGERATTARGRGAGRGARPGRGRTAADTSRSGRSRCQASTRLSTSSRRSRARTDSGSSYESRWTTPVIVDGCPAVDRSAWPWPGERRWPQPRRRSPGSTAVPRRCRSGWRPLRQQPRTRPGLEVGVLAAQLEQDSGAGAHRGLRRRRSGRRPGRGRPLGLAPALPEAAERPAITPIRADTMAKVRTTSSRGSPTAAGGLEVPDTRSAPAGRRSRCRPPARTPRLATPGAGSRATADPSPTISSAWPCSTLPVLRSPARVAGRSGGEAVDHLEQRAQHRIALLVSLSPLRTTTRSRSGTTIVYWPR